MDINFYHYFSAQCSSQQPTDVIEDDERVTFRIDNVVQMLVRQR